jgi:hypothetical protein
MYGVPLLYNKPYNAYPLLEAAGAKLGRPEDASDGMPRWQDSNQKEWAFNSAVGEWERIHTIKSGDTLWKLSGLYYGTSSMGGVHAIYNVPQNKSIQGPSPDSGLIPGDVILIPGLPQPTTPPSTSDAMPIGAFPDAPPSTAGLPTVPPGGNIPVPLPSAQPAGWPSDEDYPPIHEATDMGGTGPIVLPTVTVDGDVPATTAGQTTTSGKPAQFWSTGRILAASAVGAAGLGTVIYLATKKKRRRRAS